MRHQVDVPIDRRVNILDFIKSSGIKDIHYVPFPEFGYSVWMFGSEADAQTFRKFAEI